MSNLWGLFITLIQAGLAILAQWYGGSVGMAIVTLSLIVRLALLPLTLYLGRRTQRREALLKELQPELERLRSRYGKDPEKLGRETMELYRRHNVRPVDAVGWAGVLVQMPFMAGLYTAIQRGLGAGSRFLWIADLSQADLLLALLVAGLTALAGVLQPNAQPQARLMLTVLPALATLLFVGRLAAGLGLYWAASSAVGVVQSLLLRRRPAAR